MVIVAFLTLKYFVFKNHARFCAKKVQNRPLDSPKVSKSCTIHNSPKLILRLVLRTLAQYDESFCPAYQMSVFFTNKHFVNSIAIYCCITEMLRIKVKWRYRLRLCICILHIIRNRII